MRWFIILLSFWSAVQAADAVVRFHSEVTLPRGEVRLQDVAEIVADSVIKARLGSIEVGVSSSRPGQRRLMQTSTLVTFYIQPLCSDLQISYENEGRIELHTEGKEYSREELESHLRAFLEPRLEADDKKRYEIDVVRFPRSFVVPAKDVEIKWEVNSRFKDRGQQNVYAKVFHDGRLWQKLSFGVYIRKFAHVLVSSRPLQRNAQLSMEDIVLEEREVTHLNRPPLQDADRFSGYMVKRTTASGKILNMRMLEKPWLVRRGEASRMFVKLGNGAISTRVIAGQDGREGQIIRVRNVQSQKVLQARVSEDGTLWAVN
jgi:flagella basal body P-ring formation protein FlgA